MDGDQIYGANICKYMGMKILLYIYIYMCVCIYMFYKSENIFLTCVGEL